MNSLQDGFAHPPYGIRDELETPCRVEAPRCLHETHVALVDKVAQVETAALVLLGNRHNEPEVGLHEPTVCVLAALLNTVGEFGILVRSYHRDAVYVPEIAVDGHGPGRHGLYNLNLLHNLSNVPGRTPQGWNR